MLFPVLWLPWDMKQSKQLGKMGDCLQKYTAVWNEDASADASFYENHEILIISPENRKRSFTTEITIISSANKLMAIKCYNTA